MNARDRPTCSAVIGGLIVTGIPAAVVAIVIAAAIGLVVVDGVSDAASRGAWLDLGCWLLLVAIAAAWGVTAILAAVELLREAGIRRGPR